MTDSRSFVPTLTATLQPLEEGRIALRSPSPGYWREAPALGTLLRPGASLGIIEVLGVHHRLEAPEGAVGVVVEAGDSDLARPPVDYGAQLLVLDPKALSGDLAAEAAAATATDEQGLVYRAPSSGRFYRRPSPDKPNFVELDQVVERGQTLGLLEVMKTFTRINYDDAKLPAKAKIVKILAEDQADIERNAPLFLLEEAT